MAVFAYCVVLAGVIGFQIALIFGAPWGRLTQGGANDGPLPTKGRSLAGLSILILIGMGGGALSASGIWPDWPAWTIWPALAVQSLSCLANWITPSRPERQLWGPITTGMLLLLMAVALF